MPVTLLWTALALLCLCRDLNATLNLDNETCAGQLLDNRRLDVTLLQSKHVMDIFHVQRMDALSTHQCIRMCCSTTTLNQSQDPCEIAEFDSRLTTQNCLLVSCSGTSVECGKYDVINGNEHVKTFAVNKSVSNSTTTTTTNATEDIELVKDSTPKIERTIVPRKGVDETNQRLVQYASNHSATSTTDKLDVTTLDPATSSIHSDTSATNDPTEEPTTYAGDVTQTAASDIAPSVRPVNGNPANTPVPDLDADKHKHTVPRKGVIGELDDFVLQQHNGQSKIETSSNFKKLSFAITAENNTRNSNQDNSEKINEDARNTTQIGSEISMASAEKKMAAATRPKIGHDVSSGLSGSEVGHNNATLGNSDSQLKTNSSSSSTGNGDGLETVKSGAKNSSAVPLLVKMLASATIVSTVASANLSSAAPTTNDLYLSETENENELSVEQSVYLIVSLLIGFVVLLTVIGLIIRHVHGVWERRHYHRMDFLIDGMYNTM